jgi:hypothetical protein
MRKLLLGVCTVLVFGSSAMAQTKFQTKWKCSKPAVDQKLDVGDMADHSYAIDQGTCAATASDKDFAEKSGAYTEFRESWKDKMSWHGRYNVTTDGGDKLFYVYSGSGPTDITKPIGNKWTIEGGTGKHKGIKGSGTCSATRNADGTADYTCTGTYTIGTTAKAAKKAK